MWEYTDTVREHFLKPRNAGELADANAIGEVGSLACGDALKLFLKINDEASSKMPPSRRLAVPALLRRAPR